MPESPDPFVCLMQYQPLCFCLRSLIPLISLHCCLYLLYLQLFQFLPIVFPPHLLLFFRRLLCSSSFPLNMPVQVFFSHFLFRLFFHLYFLLHTRLLIVDYEIRSSLAVLPPFPCLLVVHIQLLNQRLPFVRRHSQIVPKIHLLLSLTLHCLCLLRSLVLFLCNFPPVALALCPLFLTLFRFRMQLASLSRSL